MLGKLKEDLVMKLEQQKNKTTESDDSDSSDDTSVEQETQNKNQIQNNNSNKWDYDPLKPKYDQKVKEVEELKKSQK